MRLRIVRVHSMHVASSLLLFVFVFVYVYVYVLLLMLLMWLYPKACVEMHQRFVRIGTGHVLAGFSWR